MYLLSSFADLLITVDNFVTLTEARYGDMEGIGRHGLVADW